MRLRLLFVSLVLFSISTLACGFVGGGFSPTPTLPGATLPPVAPQSVAGATATATIPPSIAPGAVGSPIESIALTSPLPNQGVRNSIHVEGYSDPTFEQQLGILVRDANGSVIGSATAKIQADVGQRGAFAVDVPFQVFGDPPGRIVVYVTSPRDGGPTHLSSVDVQLNSDVQSSIPSIDLNRAESIVISSPVPNATLHGSATVSGVSDPTFDQTLIVEVRGQNNVQLGRATTHINAAVGQRGPFSINMPFQAFGDPPGRIVVYALSPRDGKTVHLSSVEVNLQP